MRRLAARGDKTKAAHFLDWADTVVFQRKRSEFPCASHSESPVTDAIINPIPGEIAQPAQSGFVVSPLAAVQSPIVRIEGRRVFATSRDVALYFEKRHDHVLRDIDELISHDPILGDVNFQQVSTAHPTVRGRFDRMFEMDSVGFQLLAMGFTGPKALQFKLKYIQAFEDALDRVRELEARVAAPVTPALPNFNDPVAAARAWADAVEKTQEAEKLVEAREKEVKLLSADVKHAQEVIHENLKLVGVAEWCASRHIYLRKPMKNRLSAKTKELHIARGVSYSKQFRMVPLPDGTEKPGHINIYHADLMDEAARDMGLDFTPVRF